MKKSFSTKSQQDRKAWSNPDSSSNILALNTILKRQKFSVSNIKPGRSSHKALPIKKKPKKKNQTEKLMAKSQKQFIGNTHIFVSPNQTQTFNKQIATIKFNKLRKLKDSNSKCTQSTHKQPKCQLKDSQPNINIEDIRLQASATKQMKKKLEKTAKDIARDFIKDSHKTENNKREFSSTGKKDMNFIISDENYYNSKECDNQPQSTQNNANKYNIIVSKPCGQTGADSNENEEKKDRIYRERETFKRCSSAKLLGSKKKEGKLLDNSAGKLFRNKKSYKVTPKQAASNIMIKKALKMLNKVNFSKKCSNNVLQEKNEQNKIESKDKCEKKKRKVLLEDFNKRIRCENVPKPQVIQENKKKANFAWGVDQRKFQSRDNSSSCGHLHKKKEKLDSEERRELMGLRFVKAEHIRRVTIFLCLKIRISKERKKNVKKNYSVYQTGLAVSTNSQVTVPTLPTQTKKL